MPARPATTEYRTNFLDPTDHARGHFPSLYGTAPNRSLDSAIRRPFEKQVTNNTLMDDWLYRTKSRHFGAFRDSFPKAAPFSEYRREDTNFTGEKKLPALFPAHSMLHTDNLPQPSDDPAADERYRQSYNKLMKKLNERRAHVADIKRKLPAGGKGVWRHIKQSYGAGSNLISWLDGARSLEDGGALEPSVMPTERRKEAGGKGPNRHIIDSYGAGPSVITWMAGSQVGREDRFSTCMPLPTKYQEQKGVYPLIGGRMIRPDVKGLRD